MKTVYFIIIGLIVSLSLTLTFHQTFAVNLSGPISSEEVLEKYDLVVLGTITHIEKQAEEEEEPATFHIEIKEIIKDDGSFENNDNSQILKTIGCTPKEEKLRGHWCPRYDMGDRGLFLLSNTEQGYDIAFDSQTSKVNCTAKQFLDNYHGWKTGLFWNQTSSDYGYRGAPKHLFTNEAIELYHTVRNQDMKEKDYSIKFNARTGQSVFSDIVNGTIPECKRELTISSIFTLTVMGTYGFFIGSNNDTGAGSGSFGTPIIDFGATPKEQLNAGIKGQDIWCKDDFVLIFKNDDTPDRRYDNYTACVTMDTAEKLVQRNWGFVLE